MVGYSARGALSVAPLAAKKALIVGSCQMLALGDVLTAMGVETEFAMAGASGQQDGFDFRIIQAPVRAFAPEPFFIRRRDHNAAFDECIAGLSAFVGGLLAAPGNPLTFVLNFLAPQSNAMGRFAPRYDLSNPVYWFECMNQELDRIVRQHSNAYVVDIDGLSAMHGRRRFQDDSLTTFSHSALLSDFGYEKDQQRLVPTHSPSTEFQTESMTFVEEVAQEILAQFRTLRQTDQVKLVAFDLDDTLWRGVLAEEEAIDRWEVIDGWPYGLVEAVSYLKRRGVMVALLSKNDEDKARRLWDDLYGKVFPIEEFVAVKINWRPKAQNLAEIIEAVNILPSSVVFVDDNPVERGAVARALPGVRTLGASPYSLRRDLLWSPETQVVSVTAESASRTEMVKAQIQRDEARRTMTHEEWLAQLDVRIQIETLAGAQDPKFARTLELVNKTNQFNTTGRRWSASELSDWIAAGGRVSVATVEDRYTGYGLVCVLIAKRHEVEQLVMSCRVAGLGVEQAMIADAARRAAEAGAESISARLVETDANSPVRDVWAKAGGALSGDRWLVQTSKAA